MAIVMVWYYTLNFMFYTKIFSGNLFHFIYHSIDIAANYYTIFLLKNF